jgi:IS30 family transposase
VIFEDLPETPRRSLTWDQGAEMCHHHSIAHATHMRVFFCHPGRPWQRPTNETTNGLLRDYFPKSADVAIHSRADLLRIEEELNRRPERSSVTAPQPTCSQPC